MPVTQFDQLNLSDYYTYQDYMTWTFPERVELFLGKVVPIGPSPNTYHHHISQHISMPLFEYSKNSSIQVFFAPFDVRLPVTLNEGLYDTVVQPDIVVICDPSKLDEHVCIGAPDIVIEILPPGDSKREMKDKFDLYEASLVPEYWIVDPIHQDVTIYSLNEQNKYIGSRPYLEGDSIPSAVLVGFSIDAGEVFKEQKYSYESLPSSSKDRNPLVSLQGQGKTREFQGDSIPSAVLVGFSIDLEDRLNAFF